MQMSLEVWTPERAAATLREFNSVNRTYRVSEAEKKAADMRAGNWTQ